MTKTYPALIGVAPLMRLAFSGQDLTPIATELLNRANNDPMDANALMDFSTTLQLTGNRANAMAVQAEAISIESHYVIPAEKGTGIRLLVLMGPGDLMSNTPVEFLVEHSDVTLDLCYLTAEGTFPKNIPEHDVMMVGVAESHENQPLLLRLQGYVKNWPRPVINRPEHIAILSRDGVCAALQGIVGVDMPISVRIDRTALISLSLGQTPIESFLPDGGFPIIVRPMGSHAGTNLEKIASYIDLGPYLDAVSAERFYISRFVDYRNDDDLFRKYRITLVDGVPYICHFAISSHWMIHYLNAGMTESDEKRAEEAAVMASFDHQFALRHAAAIRSIHERMQLPYLGIDCAETPSGDLLIFESDNAMIVHGMDPESLFPYKKPIMDKLFRAFRVLLEKSIGDQKA
jgi:hypothetical protein